MRYESGFRLDIRIRLGVALPPTNPGLERGSFQRNILETGHRGVVLRIASLVDNDTTGSRFNGILGASNAGEQNRKTNDRISHKTHFS